MFCAPNAAGQFGGGVRRPRRDVDLHDVEQVEQVRIDSRTRQGVQLQRVPAIGRRLQQGNQRGIDDVAMNDPQHHPVAGDAHRLVEHGLARHEDRPLEIGPPGRPPAASSRDSACEHLLAPG